MATTLFENETPNSDGISAQTATPTGTVSGYAEQPPGQSGGNNWSVTIGSLTLDFETVVIVLFALQALLTSIKIGMELVT